MMRLDRMLSGGPKRQQLFILVARRLVDPVEPPTSVADAVEPMRWFLERASSGIPLTATGALGRAFVREIWERFGWANPVVGLPYRETDVVQLVEIHDLAAAMKAIRRRSGKLWATPAGRQLVANPVELWRRLSRELMAGNDFEEAANEIAWTILALAREPLAVEDVEKMVEEILVEDGWRPREDAEYPLERSVQDAVWRLLRPANALSMLTYHGPRELKTELTEAGRATALEGLRSRLVE